MKKLTLAVLLAFTLAPFAIGADEKPTPDPAEVFKKLDKNSDGKLSLEEFKGKREEEAAKKAFDRIDKNKDGSISLEEFKARPMKKADK